MVSDKILEGCTKKNIGGISEGIYGGNSDRTLGGYSWYA